MTAPRYHDIQSLSWGMGQAIEQLRDSLKDAERIQEELDDLDAILCSMTEDWKPARDQSWPAKGQGRVAMLAAGDSATPDRILDGRALIWPKELMDYPISEGWVRRTRHQSRDHGRIATLADAATEPCPDCGKPAFLIVHHHEYALIPDDGVARGPTCIRRMLACLECFHLQPRTAFRCDNCIA